MENSNYSLADIAAATGEGGFGSNGFIWVLLFAMIFGGNGFFGGRNNLNDYATAASQQDILFGQKFSDLGASINKVGDGLSSLGYAQLQQMTADTNSINGNIVNEGRNIQSQLCTINSNIDAKFAALEKSQLEQTIAAQTARINQLELQANLCGVMRYPTSAAYAYSLPSATCGCNGNV